MSTVTNLLPRYTGRRLLAGAVGGFLSGAAFIALLSWFDTTVGKPALQPFKVIASLVQGPAAAKTGSAHVWIGMAIHPFLSVVFGVGLAVLVLPLVSQRAVAVTGLLYGGVVYAVNFQLLARFVGHFGALLAGPNQAVVLSLHFVFGVLTSLFLMNSARHHAPTNPTDSTVSSGPSRMARPGQAM